MSRIDFNMRKSEKKGKACKLLLAYYTTLVEERGAIASSCQRDWQRAWRGSIKLISIAISDTYTGLHTSCSFISAWV